MNILGKRLMHHMFESHVTHLLIMNNNEKKTLISFFLSTDEIQQVLDIYILEFKENKNRLDAFLNLNKGCLYLAESCISFLLKYKKTNDKEDDDFVRQIINIFENCLLIAKTTFGVLVISSDYTTKEFDHQLLSARNFFYETLKQKFRKS